MKKLSPADKKHLKELNVQIKGLQAELVKVNKLEGKDDYISVKVKKNPSFLRNIAKNGRDHTGDHKL